MRKRTAVADEEIDFPMVGRHEHDFRIAGKERGKILRQCSGCGRKVLRDT